MVSKLILLVFDWSEVWALFIPLVVLLFYPKQPASLKPIIIYLWLALLLNGIIDIIMEFKIYLPAWLQSNNPYYNIHSIVRFICFSIFFIRLPQSSFFTLKKILPLLSVIIIGLNFHYIENFFNQDHLSGNLLAAEAYLLLVYCMQYYLSELRDDSDALSSEPDFWIVTGLSIYVVINFFVFLFYIPMLNVDSVLAEHMWYVHNIAFIILCIFITKAFYGPFRNKYSI